MSDKYKIYNNDKAYFLTITVTGWIDVFTRKNHKMCIVDSLKYCQKEKGLVIFGYCLMPSHLHMIAKAEGKFTLSEIMRDFKKFTAKKIINQIIEEPESRREWMLKLFEEAGKKLKRIKKYKFWQDGLHAEMIDSNKFFDQKLNYIHNNPVDDRIVEHSWEYMFSSARNYADLDGMLDIALESRKMETYG